LAEEEAAEAKKAKEEDANSFTIDFDLGKSPLGMKLQADSSGGANDSGVSVKSVADGGQAHEERVQKGDIVTHVNGTDVTGMTNLADLGKLVHPKRKNSFTFLRGVLALTGANDHDSKGVVGEVPDPIPEGAIEVIITREFKNQSLGFKVTKDLTTGKGTAVKSIDFSGLAKETALEEGQVITHINGYNVTDVRQIAQLAPLLKQGMVVKLWCEPVDENVDLQARAARAALHQVDDTEIMLGNIEDKLKSLFAHADQGEFGTGTPDNYLDSNELNHRLDLNEIEALLKRNNAMQYFDADGDGNLSLAELLEAIGKKDGESVSMEEFLTVLMQAFNKATELDRRASVAAADAGRPPVLEDLSESDERKRRVSVHLDNDRGLKVAHNDYLAAKAEAEQAQNSIEAMALTMQKENDPKKKSEFADTLRKKGIELLSALTSEEEAKAAYEDVRDGATKKAEFAVDVQNEHARKVKEVGVTVNMLVSVIAETTAELGTVTDQKRLQELTAFVTTRGNDLSAALAEQKLLQQQIKDGIRPESMAGKLANFKEEMAVLKSGVLASSADAISGRAPAANAAMEDEMVRMKEELAQMKEQAAQSARDAETLRLTAEQAAAKQAQVPTQMEQSNVEAAMEEMRKELFEMKAASAKAAQATENARLTQMVAAMAAEMAAVKETALTLKAAAGDAAAAEQVHAAHTETVAAKEAEEVAREATAMAEEAQNAPEEESGKKKTKLVAKARWQIGATKSVAEAAEQKKKRLLDEIAKSPDELEKLEMNRKLRLERAKERRNRELARQAQKMKEAALNNEAVVDEPGSFVLGKSLRQWSGTVESESRGSGA